MKTLFELIQAHPQLHAVAILLGAVLAGFIADLVVRRVLRRLTRRTQTTLDDVIIDALRRPLFVSVLFAGIGVALPKLEPTETTQYVVQGLLITIAVLMWSGALFRSGKAVLGVLAARQDEFAVVNTRTIPLFDIVVKIVVVAAASYGVLLAWDVDVTAWLASAGVMGIAIGFAAKDTLSNFFAGIFILADAPYKLGDFVVLASGERGMVTDIGIRSTRLLTRDDIQIIVPNASIGNAKIMNESGGPHEKERIRVTIGVAYGSDVEHVREVLMQAAADAKYLAKDPAPRVRFRTFDESALNFQLMGWIDEPVLRGRALDDLNAKVYNALNASDIEIPYPHRVVHLKRDQDMDEEEEEG